jgi:hypothetical protein
MNDSLTQTQLEEEGKLDTGLTQYFYMTFVFLQKIYNLHSSNIIRV